MNLKLIITLIAVGLLSAACGSDSQEPPSNDLSHGSVDTLPKVDSVRKAKPWSGSAVGYVHSSESTDDRIELFIRLGRLLGAASTYNHRAGEMRSLNASDGESIAAGHAYLATLFNQALLNSYSAVEPMVQAYNKNNNTSLDIQSTLLGLNDPQQIVDVSSGDRSKRDQQYAANQKVQLVSSRIRDAVIAFFPSRHEYLLASSALIREAGDKVAFAVSADGVVLSTNLLWEAYALIDRSIKLDPGNISYCDAQRIPISAHKKAIDDLLNKMVPNQLGQKLTVTATDVYQLAEQAHAAGERFPITDSEGCS